MRLVITTALLLTFSAAVAAQKNTAAKTSVLEVAGMSCSVCAKTVEKATLKLPGVTAVKVDQPSGKAEVQYEPGKTTPEEIAKAITRRTGFEARAKSQPK